MNNMVKIHDNDHSTPLSEVSEGSLLMFPDDEALYFRLRNGVVALDTGVYSHYKTDNTIACFPLKRGTVVTITTG